MFERTPSNARIQVRVARELRLTIKPDPMRSRTFYVKIQYILIRWLDLYYKAIIHYKATDHGFTTIGITKPTYHQTLLMISIIISTSKINKTQLLLVHLLNFYKLIWV